MWFSTWSVISLGPSQKCLPKIDILIESKLSKCVWSPRFPNSAPKNRSPRLTFFGFSQVLTLWNSQLEALIKGLVMELHNDMFKACARVWDFKWLMHMSRNKFFFKVYQKRKRIIVTVGYLDLDFDIQNFKHKFFHVY